jgi:hypothetical protein
VPVAVVDLGHLDQPAREAEAQRYAVELARPRTTTSWS